jgi:hypothetical protein
MKSVVTEFMIRAEIGFMRLEATASTAQAETGCMKFAVTEFMIQAGTG